MKFIEVLQHAHEAENYQLFGSLLSNLVISEIIPEIVSLIASADFSNCYVSPLLKSVNVRMHYINEEC